MQIGLHAVPRPGALDDKSLLQALSAYVEYHVHSIICIQPLISTIYLFQASRDFHLPFSWHCHLFSH